MAFFDVNAAINAGYSYSDIANFLGQKKSFDVDAARKSGYNDLEIIGFLAGKPAAPPPPPPPPTTIGGQVKEFVRGVPAGFVGTIGTALEGLESILPESWEKPAVEKTRSIVQSLTPRVAPGYEDSIARKLGEALGSVGSFAIPGAAATKLAGTALAGVGTAGVLGSAAGAGEARQRAELEGATPEEKATATRLGAVVGLSELAPARRLLRFLDEAPGVKEGIAKRLIELAKTGGIEAAQEGAQQISQNLIAQKVYNPEQELLTGAGEEAAYGGAAGVMADVLMNMVFGKRAGPAVKPSTAPAAQPAAPTETEVPQGVAAILDRPMPTTSFDAHFDYAMLKEMSKSYDTPEVQQRLAELKTLKQELFKDEKARGKTDPEKVRQQLAEVGIDVGETAGISRQEPYEVFGAPVPVQGEFRETMGDIEGPTSFRPPVEPAPVRAEEPVEGIAPTSPEYNQYRQSLLLAEKIKDLRSQRRDAVTKEEKDAINKQLKQYEAAYSQSRELAKGAEFGPPSESQQLPLAPRPAPETLLNEEALAGLGLPKQSGYYRQLLGKDVAKEQDAAAVRAVVEKAQGNPNVGKGTRDALTALESKLFGTPETTQQGLDFTETEEEPVVVEPKVRKKKAAKAATEEQEVEVPETTEKLTPESAFDPNKEVFVGAFSKGAGRWPRTMRDVTLLARKTVGLDENASSEELWNAFRELKNQAKIEKLIKRKFGQSFDFYVSAARPKEIRPVSESSGIARVLSPFDVMARQVAEEVSTQDPETLSDNAANFIVKQAGRRQANGMLSGTQQRINEGWTAYLDATNSSIKDAIRRMAADIYFKLELEDGIPEGTGKKEATFLKKTLTANGKKLLDKYTAQFEEQDRKAKGFTRAFTERQKVKQAEEEENLSFEEAERLDRGEELQKQKATEAEKAKPARKEREANLQPKKPAEPASPNKEGFKVPETAPDWVQPALDNYNARLVYLDNDLALIETFAKNGESSFSMVKKGLGWSQVDVSALPKKSDFDFADIGKMLEAKALVLKEQEKELKNNPDGVFKNSNLVFGKDISENIQNIAKDWVKQLGLTDARIVFTSKESGLEIANTQYGRFRKIGYASLENAATYGYMMPLGGKDYAITIPVKGSTLKQLEVLAHELGHITERLAYANAPKEVKEAIQKEFEKWALENKGKLAREFVDSMRSYRSARQMRVDPDLLAKNMYKFNSYWSSFSEWYADQVARWATTQEKPLSVVSKFFKRLADKLKSFFVGEREQFLPNKTVSQWLNTLSENTPDIGRHDVGGVDGSEAQNPIEEADSFISAMGLSPTAGKADPSLLSKLGSFLTDPQYRQKGIDWFRAKVVYKGAGVERKAQDVFNNAVADSLGNIRPDFLGLQAEHSDNIAGQAMLKGGMSIDKATGLWEAVNKDASLTKVFEIINGLGQKIGDKDKAFQIAHGAFLMRRANILKAKDIIPVHFTQDQINAGLKAFNTYPELNEAFNTFTEFKNNMIDAMVEGGRLSKEQAQGWKDAVDYVPWNRIKEYEDEIYTSPQAYFRGLTNLRSMKQLKGGADEINNVFDNIVGLSFWMANNATRNYAAVKYTDLLVKLGDARRVYQGQSGLNKANLVNIYRNGELETYELESAIDAMAFRGTESISVPVLGAFANFLRKTTTSMPTFALSQLAQDSYRAILYSGLQRPFGAPAAILSNFAKELKGDELTDKLASYGIIGAYDLVPGQAREQIEKKLGLVQQSAFKKGWDALEKFSLASDAAQRRAIYEKTIQETGNQQLAVTRAMEIINFKRQGASKTVGILRQIVPFFNAYLQGMDVLYRTLAGRGLAGKERAEAVNLFWKTGLKLAALSTIYAALVSGDDEYEKLRGYEKDRNFVFPGTGIKIPVAQEVGFMFKVLPERTYHYIMSQGTASPDDATKMMKGTRDAFIDAFTGPNLQPQFVKPLLEVTTNYSFFTQSPIVGRGQENKTSYTQFTANTSELAKIIGKLGNLVVDGGFSPMKIDYLMRAYTGIAGGTVLAISDEAIAGSERPPKNWYELPQIRTFAYDQIGGGLKEDFYDFRDRVTQVNNTVNDLRKHGKAEELAEYLTPERLELYKYKGYVYQIEQIQESLRAYKKFIQNDKKLSDEVKLQKINELDERENRLLENIRRTRVKAGL